MPGKGIYNSIRTYWTENDPERRHKLSILAKIEEIVSEIMIEFGPDGHTDGSWQLTHLIKFMILSSDKEKENLLQKIDFEEVKEIIFRNNQEKKKTSKEWYSEIESKIIIIDPDGWDRLNYEYSFNKEKITNAEFNKRLYLSTIQAKDTKKGLLIWDDLKTLLK